ncbi:MAG: division/cell wall cluster transcriptional repressor MraZ [Sandaracinaceae bacterium]
MFRGQYEHAIDGKGRTSVPSGFRSVLADREGGERLVLTTGLEACLVVYPMAEWVAFEERLSRLPRFDRSVQRIRRIYVSSAIELEMDRLGRILIPANLRRHAGLERQALWAGMGDYVELWSKARFDALREEVLSDPAQRAEMEERLAELGL